MQTESANEPNHSAQPDAILLSKYKDCKKYYKQLCYSFLLCIASLFMAYVCARLKSGFSLIMVILFIGSYFTYFELLARLCKANDKNRLLWLGLTFSLSFIGMLFALGAIGALGRENNWLPPLNQNSEGN
jgi:hypothetical protein